MSCFRLTAQAFALTFAAVLAVQAADPGDLISGSFNAKARDVRARMARDLLSDVSRFADLVQTPRPSDVTWVDEEEASIRRLGNAEASMARRVQFYDSPEFQHVKVHKHLQEIKNSFRCIVEPATGLQREMFCWAAVAFLLGDKYVFGDGVKILHRTKRLPDDTVRRTGVGTLDGIGLRYEMYSRGIQEHLVLPYLRGDFK